METFLTLVGQVACCRREDEQSARATPDRVAEQATPKRLALQQRIDLVGNRGYIMASALAACKTRVRVWPWKPVRSVCWGPAG